MELFKLLGTIAVENAEAKKALNEVSQEGGKTESKLSKAFGVIGKGAAVAGKAIATGLAAGATACVGLATAAIKSYADYEQLVGGSQLLFGDAFGYVEEQAKNAYKTVQMSTNDYLQQVNGFSTGLKTALGGNEQAAAELAHKIVVAEADIVAATGNSAENVQNAFNGIMKSNFTMLDNLQLGITPTKEGFQEVIDKVNEWNTANGEATKYQIDNLADCQAALVDYIEMQGLAGYASNEAAGTIQGSWGMLKGAWSNLLVGFSDPSADLQSLISNVFESATTFAGNLVPRITQVLQGIATSFKTLVPMLAGEIPKLFQEVLPAVVEGAVALIDGIVSALPGVIDAILAALPMLIEGLMTVVDGLIGALPQIMQSIVSALPTLIPQLIDAVTSLVLMLVEMLPQIIQPLVDSLPDIIISIVEALVNNLPALIEGLIQLVMGIVQAIPQIIQGLADATPTIVSLLITAILENLPAIIMGLIQVVMAIVASLPSIFGSLIQGIVGIFQGIWDALKNVFGSLGEWFANLWAGLSKSPAVVAFKDAITAVWNAIKTAISTIINAIKTVITTVWNAIKTAVSTVVDAIKTVITTVWNAIKTTISSVMDGIKNVISTAWNFIKEKIIQPITEAKTKAVKIFNDIKTGIQEKITAVKDKVSEIFSNIKEKISSTVENIKTKVTTVFSNVKEAMEKPINKAKETISGIVDKIKGFFSGMKLDFPKIKLPHFSIKPSGWKIGDLLEGSIPKLSIDWYAKAMKNPMIMTKPTIFGYDAASGQLMGGGEAGSEVVAGTATLMNMIQNAVAEQNGTLNYYLQKIVELLATFFPEQIESFKNMKVQLNTGALVGELVVPMDEALGILSERKGRGI